MLSLAKFGLARAAQQSVLTCLDDLKAARETHGSSHPVTVLAMRALAHAFIAKGRWGDALSVLEEALPLHVTHFGEHNPDTIALMIELAVALQVRPSPHSRHARARAAALTLCPPPPPQPSALR
jgi:hypothetical protein